MKKKNNIKNLNSIFLKYNTMLRKGLNSVNKKSLFDSSLLIEKTIKNNSKIFVAGNGGSAAVSNHFICDFLKNIKFYTKLNPKVISLSNNVEAIMAISNDLGYKNSLAFQAKSLLQKDDIFVIISSSGNSKNIIELIKLAKKNGNSIIGMSAFNGGYLKQNSDIHMHVKVNDYAISEDIFQSIMHLFVKIICSINKK